MAKSGDKVYVEATLIEVGDKGTVLRVENINGNGQPMSAVLLMVPSGRVAGPPEAVQATEGLVADVPQDSLQQLAQGARPGEEVWQILRHQPNGQTSRFDFIVSEKDRELSLERFSERLIHPALEELLD